MEGDVARQVGVSKIKSMSARLSAVQAVYQMSQNKQPVDALYDEYIRYRAGMEIEGEELAAPDARLLRTILFGVAERGAELQSIVDANLKREGEARGPEPLLYAILLCGAYELMLGQVDAPIVINDYLNVAHTFFERGEVAVVNGVLDSVSKLFS